MKHTQELTRYENERFGQERALYMTRSALIRNCRFEGEEDGESALKESKYLTAEYCFFDLRYPFWHVEGLHLRDSELTKNCRAALWYDRDITIERCKLHGIKAVRECKNVSLRDCDIDSPEFGWSSKDVRMENTTAVSEYFMMRSEGLAFRDVRFKGKYSFQYVKDAVFENCTFDTKDAFWHARNVTVKNSVIRGEYLAWYSEGLTLERCVITGTQPLCWCRGLRLIDCELRGADLCFEKSDVTAELTAPVISIKNPRSGRILVPAAGEIIRDDARARGEVVLTGMPAAPRAGA